ncbi:MAG: hypothetical protein J6V06_01385, partial [Clostridia bacterium]|nr:hypothetical protein [Clostridia bacterium]
KRPAVTGVVPLTLRAGEKAQLETKVELSENAEAPIEKNQILGSVTIRIGDREIASYNLISENYVEKTNIGHIIVRFLSSLAKSA